MVRQNPPSFVLIDLGGTAGESIYPLSLGYGAIGQGGTLDCPPHETGPFPIRAGKGDYHRLAMTLRHEIMDVIQPMLLRADNLSIAKPDPSLLVRGLNALVGDVWAKDRDVTFRTQLVKSRLGVDVSPTWESALQLHQHLRAEAENMVHALPTTTTKPAVGDGQRDPKLRPLQPNQSQGTTNPAKASPTTPPTTSTASATASGTGERKCKWFPEL